jgi:hypothetical protein
MESDTGGTGLEQTKSSVIAIGLKVNINSSKSGDCKRHVFFHKVEPFPCVI